jgi:hypothetical protein
MAQTLPIFTLAKGPLGITLVVAQLAINLYNTHPMKEDVKEKNIFPALAGNKAW